MLVVVSVRDTNSFWRKTAAYSCMFLLDFPLSVAYTCTGGFLAIPAVIITGEPKKKQQLKSASFLFSAVLHCLLR